MKKNYILVLFMVIIGFMFFCSSCGEDDKYAVIYIAGYTTDNSDITVPCYWKNGTRTDLPVIDNTNN
ncbi:MAG: hypothetical protein KAS64_01325, partial [Spirochaetes bacterium]|nr:hypothetical protein [Spirochaetota bacterium]